MKTKNKPFFIFIVILTLSYLLYVKEWDNTFMSVSKIDMCNFLYRWSKEGKPEGKKLEELLIDFNSNVIQTNREFIINDTNFTSIFAYLRYPKKTLFATTNMLIFVNPSGKIIGKPMEWKYEGEAVDDSEKLNKEISR